MEYTTLAIVSTFVLGIALNVAFQFWGRWLIKYRITESAIAINICNRVILLSLPYWSIKSVRTISSIESIKFFRSIQILNRLFGRRVIIERRTGPAVIITPDNPEVFGRLIVRRIAGELEDEPVL